VLLIKIACIIALFVLQEGHKHGYFFDDLYGVDEDKYFKCLKNTIKLINSESVVITGECDPTQNLRWAKGVASVCREIGAKVEIQTHNLNMCIDKLDFADVVSYSVTNVREYLSSWQCVNGYDGKSVSRMVIILNKDFEFLDKDNFCRMGFDQVTFKNLNYGEDDDINRWIDDHKISDTGLDKIRDIVSSRNGSKASVRLDLNCQDARGRYVVFRSDGYTYKDWESKSGTGNMLGMGSMFF